MNAGRAGKSDVESTSAIGASEGSELRMSDEKIETTEVTRLRQRCHRQRRELKRLNQKLLAFRGENWTVNEATNRIAHWRGEFVKSHERVGHLTNHLLYIAAQQPALEARIAEVIGWSPDAASIYLAEKRKRLDADVT